MLESEHLLERLDEYDPDVSAGVAADAAAMIRDLQAELARVTAEREDILTKDRIKTREINILTAEVRSEVAKLEAAEAALSAHREALKKVVLEMRQAAILMGQSGSSPIGHRVQQWADRLTAEANNKA